jgi:hypothetical protein
MSRGGVEILDDDEEADIASFMLNACGLESRDFFLYERSLTRENFEKNYDTLVRMAQNRSSRRAPYFVIGYFALLTGSKISEDLRQDILEAADWKHEENYWRDSSFALNRKVYLEDFREKIRIQKPGQILHPAKFSHSIKALKNSQVIIGINHFQKISHSNEVHRIKYINLDGWSLKRIPKAILNFQDLKGLSLRFNQLRRIPAEISNLKKLKYLYLDYNYLNALPDEIGMLSLLNSLDLAYNNISELPESLKNLRDLNYICVRGTGILNTPIFLKNLKYDELTQTLFS